MRHESTSEGQRLLSVSTSSYVMNARFMPDGTSRACNGDAAVGERLAVSKRIDSLGCSEAASVVASSFVSRREQSGACSSSDPPKG